MPWSPRAASAITRARHRVRQVRRRLVPGVGGRDCVQRLFTWPLLFRGRGVRKLVSSRQLFRPAQRGQRKRVQRLPCWLVDEEMLCAGDGVRQVQVVGEDTLCKQGRVGVNLGRERVIQPIGVVARHLQHAPHRRTRSTCTRARSRPSCPRRPAPTPSRRFAPSGTGLLRRRGACPTLLSLARRRDWQGRAHQPAPSKEGLAPRDLPSW